MMWRIRNCTAGIYIETKQERITASCHPTQRSDHINAWYVDVSWKQLISVTYSTNAMHGNGMLTNWAYGPEPRSSGGNTSSKTQVSALIPRPVSNGIKKMFENTQTFESWYFFPLLLALYTNWETFFYHRILISRNIENCWGFNTIQKVWYALRRNYRPVSILAALSKVFEKVHCKQMTPCFNDLFPKLLSNFRKKYGCQSALLRMFEYRKSAMGAGKLVGTVAIDLSKAFDSLPHSLLITKIDVCGFHLSACK